MQIIRAAVGGRVFSFDEHHGAKDVWNFLYTEILSHASEVAVVIENQWGMRIGEIWHFTEFEAICENADVLWQYLKLCGMDAEPHQD